MTKTCIRLAPEVLEKLQAEAKELSELSGKTVTVSDLLRACVREKLADVSQQARRETLLLSELREEVGRHGERVENLTREVGVLVEKLVEGFQEMATRQQFHDLEKTLIRVLEATRR